MAIERNKLKTLNKLIDNGVDTEKKITAMDLQQILAVPGITVPEIHIITELQNAIKARKIIAYLGEGTDEAESQVVTEDSNESVNEPEDVIAAIEDDEEYIEYEEVGHNGHEY